MIKIIVLLSTLLVGVFYTRREISALIRYVTEKDYAELYELNRAVARREFAI
ncbi:hypothetical protein QT06_C0001G0464 [archaeon GW2011_AR15]|nr:hypothetical protein QT06_C0001G0464 [archaeon GW2011_AR15]MBS3103775.1 hypothetical protein [Candidatus Woesearchaeota archaeon]